MIKSPLRYPGGKSRAVKFLAQHLPGFDEFREVFFGGGSFAFHCVQQFPDKKYLASDLNYELHCFWSQLKDNPKQLINSIQKIYNAHKATRSILFANGKSLFEMLVSRREKNLTELQRAIDFFVLNRITFSGVVDSGGYSQGSFDGRFTQTAIDRLWKAAPIAKQIDFYCEDFEYLIKKKGNNVFLFLDPPYHSATKSKLYGKNGILHTQFDHEKLFRLLRDSKHKWMITYDNSDYIRKLYNDYHQIEWSLQYGMTNSTSTQSNELLIVNYDLKPATKSNSLMQTSRLVKQ